MLTRLLLSNDHYQVPLRLVEMLHSLASHSQDDSFETLDSGGGRRSADLLHFLVEPRIDHREPVGFKF